MTSFEYRGTLALQHRQIVLFIPCHGKDTVRGQALT